VIKVDAKTGGATAL